MGGRPKREIRDQEVQGLKCLRKIRPLLSRLRTVGAERDRAGNRRLFMDQYCALILMSLFSPAIQSLRDLQRASTLDKVRKRLSAYRLHAHFEVLSGKAVRIDATSANPKGAADERAVLERTVESDRCYVIDRGDATFGLWNVINAKGSSYVCRVRDKITATVTQVNELTDADRVAGVISDERVDLGWRTRYRTGPDHPTRLIQVAVKPHESYRGMKGPRCDGVLRIATNRFDLSAELIAEMYRLRWLIEMFFRTFKQLLGCRHLFSDNHNGVEIQAYCAMIVCMLILIYTGEKPNRAMYQMVWYYLIGLASLKELEAFIKSRQ
jgi:hypothetical protein